jgi:hypothetical protein
LDDGVLGCVNLVFDQAGDVDRLIVPAAPTQGFMSGTQDAGICCADRARPGDCEHGAEHKEKALSHLSISWSFPLIPVDRSMVSKAPHRHPVFGSSAGLRNFCV